MTGTLRSPSMTTPTALKMGKSRQPVNNDFKNEKKRLLFQSSHDEERKQGLDFSHPCLNDLSDMLALGDLLVLRVTSHAACDLACKKHITLDPTHISSVIGSIDGNRDEAHDIRQLLEGKAVRNGEVSDTSNMRNFM